MLNLLRTPACLLLVLLVHVSAFAKSEPESFDIVIYGGTSAGLVAGFQAVKSGRSVVVIEPTNRVGGLTTGGLGQTDIGNKQVIGGMSREFYQRVAKFYADDANWKWQAKSKYRGGGQSVTNAGESTMWTFEPSAALAIYQAWIRETGLNVQYNQRLDRESGVEMKDGQIVSITMEGGQVYRAKVFIDATYEGDLMAAANVSYFVGRESNSKFDETYNGTQTKNAVHHNFVDGVDPYVVPGDPESGLLPFIDAEGPAAEGEGDHRLQAYCFRMCLTDHPENRIPFAKPEGYQELWYEALFRNYEAGASTTHHPWINSAMPNRKTDTNNRAGFSTDFIGQNYDYPEASYAEREQIVARHRRYQQGLMWTMANHPRIPEAVRREYSRWGTCKDEFTSPDGWQQQLYIREARRLDGELVMSQRHCQRREVVPDSVGMGAYNMDSHHVQRYVDQQGQLKNEGDVQKGVRPYPISYRSLTPKQNECSNLLCPVCVSSTHIAFGSIRMEPVFMLLGQSSALAADLAIAADLPVQQVPYDKLKERLLAEKQILEYEVNEK